MMPTLRVRFHGGHTLDLTDPADQPFPARRDLLAAQLTGSGWYRHLTPGHPDVAAVSRFQAADCTYDMDRAWRDLTSVRRIDLLVGDVS